MSLEKRCDCASGLRGSDRSAAWCRCAHEWQIRFEIRGRRIRESASTPSRRDAEKFERERYAYYDRTTPKAGTKGDIAALAALDIERGESEGVTEAELKYLEYAWRQIARHMGGTSPCTVITYDNVERYTRTRLAEGVSGTTVRRERQRIAWAAGVAHRKGWLPMIPATWPKVRGTPKDARRAGKLHPAPLLRRWYRELRRTHRLAYLEARLIVLTGLRDEEAARCAPDWLEIASGRPVLHVPAWAAKKRKERTIGLGREALAIIRNLARGKRPDEPLIGKRWLKKHRIAAAQALGYGKVITKRDLRHTYSTLGLEATGDATAVMSAQGHADLATTAVYQHSTLDRALAVSLGVERQLSRKTATHPYPALIGRGDVIRTHDPLTPSHVRQLLLHVKACDRCRRYITACADVPVLHHGTATDNRHRRNGS